MKVKIKKLQDMKKAIQIIVLLLVVLVPVILTAQPHPYDPSLGGGDGLSLSIGVGAENPDLLSAGRFHDINAVDGEFDGGPTVPGNAPTTFNIAMWDQALFHDGRVESLGKTEGANGDDGIGIRTPDSAFDVADLNAATDTLAAAQSRFPVASPEEMHGFSYQLKILTIKFVMHWL